MLPPVLLTLFIRPLSLNTLNYLPSGPTATVFALLAQYHATIPHVYRYRIGTTSSPGRPTPTDTNNENNDSAKLPTPSLTLLISDKSTTYIVAAQLALSQFPATLLPSAIGWIVGIAWRAELLPGLSPSPAGFRVPAWLVGERERRSGGSNGGSGSVAERERFEDLRRRLEGEAAASTSGTEGAAGQRRRIANDEGDNGEGSSGLMDRLRGAW